MLLGEILRESDMSISNVIDLMRTQLMQESCAIRRIMPLKDLKPSRHDNWLAHRNDKIKANGLKKIRIS